jgi:hypothetical protein
MWVSAARAACAFVLSSSAVACGTETHLPADAEPTSTPVAVPSPAAPLIAYAVGDRVVLPDGTHFALPMSLEFGGQITPFRGGFLVASGGEGYVLTRVGADGQAAPGECSGGLAVSEERTMTAWSVTACMHDVGESWIHRAPTEATRADEVAQKVGQYQPQVVGMIGHSVVYDGGRSTGVWITDLVDPPHRVPGLGSASDVAPSRGWVAGQLADHPDRAAVLDLESGISLWEAPGANLVEFSPDAAHVFGYQGYQTKIFAAADGTQVGVVGAFAGVRLDALAWEDESHLLGTARTESGLVIVRVALDGSVSPLPVVRDIPGLGAAFAVHP